MKLTNDQFGELVQQYVEIQVDNMDRKTMEEWITDELIFKLGQLDDDELKGFYDIAISLNMDVLIEVHNEFELDRVLILNPPMIGINNRNLKTMTVSLETSASLVKKIPQNILIVSESGFKSNKDLRFMESLGVKNFLIGETFMKSKDIQKSVKKMLHGD